MQDRFDMFEEEMEYEIDEFATIFPTFGLMSLESRKVADIIQAYNEWNEDGSTYFRLPDCVAVFSKLPDSERTFVKFKLLLDHIGIDAIKEQILGHGVDRIKRSMRCGFNSINAEDRTRENKQTVENIIQEADTRAELKKQSRAAVQSSWLKGKSQRAVQQLPSGDDNRQERDCCCLIA